MVSKKEIENIYLGEESVVEILLSILFENNSCMNYFQNLIENISKEKEA